jgi:hypothetical protein
MTFSTYISQYFRQGVQRVIYYFCLVLVIFSGSASAQVHPAENIKLNYRIIGFTVVPRRDVTMYTIEIAKGYINSQDSFRRAVCITQSGKTHKILAEVPDFGSSYTWQATFYSPGAAPYKSRLRHFSTGMINEVNPEICRLHVNQPAQKYKDAYIFLDGFSALYDMNGRPVWYLPAIEGSVHSVRDLKLTTRGTITFISNKAYEITYDGVVLWKTPGRASLSGASEEEYHHEFTRLSNGHYMVLGTEKVPLPGRFKPLRSSAEKAGMPVDEDLNNNLGKFGTIIEYDQGGNIVWSWRSSTYFLQPAVSGMLGENVNIYDVHENSFYFDEKERNIYISFKGINTLLKVKYPEGVVTGSYGELAQPSSVAKGERLFCGQHNVSRSRAKEGVVFIYNNNSCNNAPPKIKMMQEPRSAGERMKIVWEYQCGTDGNGQKKFLSGGSVNSLSDGSMLVCMGGGYSKVFILNEQKKVLWSALPMRNQGGPGWDVLPQYRASMIESREKMLGLIWYKNKSSGIASK